MTTNAGLSVQLFGTPQFWLGDHPVTALRRKNRALLTFVAANPEPVSRDQVLICFWPDHERAAAQQVLRTMLHELRRSLDDALVVDRESVALASTTCVDTRAFEAVVRRCDAVRDAEIDTLAIALARYRGDFLDGFTLVDTPTFDDWAASERERYRVLAMRGYAALARLRETRQDYGAALDALTAALRLDPLQEDVQRTMMRVRYLSGDRVGAIRQFEVLRRLLDEELGVAPMPETRSLYDRIVSDQRDQIFVPGRAITPPPAASPDDAPRQPTPMARGEHDLLPYVGRDGELDLLKRAGEAGHLALIEGELGIGKTRLADEFARQHAGLALRGTAHELERNLPYQPIIEALRELAARADWPAMRATLPLAPLWLHEVARIVPELAATPEAIATSPPNEAQVWESVVRLLHALAQQQPVTLCIDDVQWADGATLGLIGYLARRIASPTLVVLCTSRTTEATPVLTRLLQSLARDGKLARIGLPPLSADDMALLAKAFDGRHGVGLAHWLSERSEGNPFFATQLLRFARDHAWMAAGVPEQVGRSSPTDIPETIRDLIASRVTQLGDVAARALDIAAVIGREFDARLLASVHHSDEDRLLDALDELQAAALIRPRHDDTYQFDHALTRDVVLHAMGTTRLRALHRRVAEALEHTHAERLDPVAGSIAEHYLAGQWPDRAAPLGLRAGQFAASIAAWPVAIASFELALATGGADLRVAALTGLGEAHFHNSDFQQSTLALQSALAAASASNPGDAMIERIYEALTESMVPQARFAEIIAYADVLRHDGSPELALCAEYMIGLALDVQSASPAEAERHLRAAERLLNQPRGFRSRVTLAKIRFQLANVLGQQGHGRQAVAMYRDVLRLVRDDEAALNLLHTTLLYNNLAYYLHLAGDPAAADYAQVGLRFARDKGSLSHQSFLLSTAGEIALAQGDLDAAEQCFADGLATAEQHDYQERIAGNTANLGLVALRRGQPEIARERLTQAMALADRLSARHLAVRIRVWLIPLVDPEQASTLLHEGQAMARQSGFGKELDELATLERTLEPAPQ